MMIDRPFLCVIAARRGHPMVETAAEEEVRVQRVDLHVV